MNKHISKFLSLILRHEPQKIGLTLDENGWANVDELLEKAAVYGTVFNRQTLFDVVRDSDKKRFTLSDDKKRIRAAQGHSIAVDLALEASTPPAILFHGTAETSVGSILSEGIKPGNRQKVHLSLDEVTAFKVAQRHGKPVILHIDAAKMHENGIAFWQAENGVWLTDFVPIDYISLA
ncbi:RNA 2'-phosphotransferase [Bartonella sp. HY329]|uniref:RNA 2'-phosphotransferase n=1 Tax=unclassified Bartonella TaxID=2645622 RepID=UPI0021C8802D|nr:MULTISPECIES: RNA 2'-phosphotransferase [unclassified Bartonella]UXM94671.1 RNA 2'-phosphotransferase [Bartonella sp. HY329]UXN08994.1 RNA 2'-phosphotransferase [Bartonella sp. HY328]